MTLSQCKMIMGYFSHASAPFHDSAKGNSGPARHWVISKFGEGACLLQNLPSKIQEGKVIFSPKYYWSWFRLLGTRTQSPNLILTEFRNRLRIYFDSPCNRFNYCMFDVQGGAVSMKQGTSLSSLDVILDSQARFSRTWADFFYICHGTVE